MAYIVVTVFSQLLFCVVCSNCRNSLKNLSIEDSEKDKAQNGVNRASRGGLIYGSYLQVGGKDSLESAAIDSHQLQLRALPCLSFLNPQQFS